MELFRGPGWNPLFFKKYCISEIIFDENAGKAKNLDEKLCRGEGQNIGILKAQDQARKTFEKLLQKFKNLKKFGSSYPE